MGALPTFLSHHLVSILIGGLSLLLASSVLTQKRPTGSAFAWLLVIVLVPYLGIPLYLALGGRKFARRARSKSSLDLPPESAEGSAAASPPLLGDPRFFPQHVDAIEWLDEGTKAYGAFLREIRAAKKSIRLVTFVV